MNRRPRRPVPGGAYPEIAVICTDRGQHPPVTLDLLTDYRTMTPPGRVVASYRTARESTRHRQVVHDRPDPSSSIRLDGAFTYSFTCRRCARTVQLREENLLAALDRLYAMHPPNRHRYRLPISLAD